MLAVLYEHFGDGVEAGTKAVMIKPFHNRRKADVVIATKHKKYSSFFAVGNETEVTGISFHKSDGTRVVNYPKQHRENLAARNQATNEWLKHIVRIFKNARQKLIEQGVLQVGVAPSYYLEGMLYNVPIDKFGGSYSNTMIMVVNWLLEADRSSFACANGQYRLLDGNPDVTWHAANCDAYLSGLVGLWKGS